MSYHDMYLRDLFLRIRTAAVRKKRWARGSVVGLRAILQTGKSLVRFAIRSSNFPVDIILPIFLGTVNRNCIFRMVFITVKDYVVTKATECNPPE
jgi:hypothetical protein